MARYVDAAVIADHLAEKIPEQLGCTTRQRDHILREYLTVLDRQEWREAVWADLDPDSDLFTWFVGTIAARRRLRAFVDVVDEGT